eukprot:6709873-Heterocapsa_arctica.AAC.1
MGLLILQEGAGRRALLARSFFGRVPGMVPSAARLRGRGVEPLISLPRGVRRQTGFPIPIPERRAKPRKRSPGLLRRVGRLRLGVRGRKPLCRVGPLRLGVREHEGIPIPERRTKPRKRSPGLLLRVGLLRLGVRGRKGLP